MGGSSYRSVFIKSNPGIRLPGYAGYWYRCANCGKWCGRPGRDRVRIPDNCKMEVDHIKPWSQGGSDEVWNLQPMCKPCNRAKSNGVTVGDMNKILKNDILHGDIVSGYFRRKFRQSRVLRVLGVNKRK